MRLIRVQTLDQGFVTEGKENHDQTIVYSCDFGFSHCKVMYIFRVRNPCALSFTCTMQT